jgi:hypothetical protein
LATRLTHSVAPSARITLRKNCARCDAELHYENDHVECRVRADEIFVRQHFERDEDALVWVRLELEKFQRDGWSRDFQ